MANPIDELELKRREYELKRHDFLARVYDTHYSIALRLSTLCLTGNIAGVIAIWSGLKSTVPTKAWFAIGAFTLGIFLAVSALTSFCIAAGALKTMWQTAAGRHFDPAVEFPTADESKNRRIHNITNRAGDSCLNWSSAAFMIGAVYAIWSMQTLLSARP